MSFTSWGPWRLNARVLVLEAFIDGSWVYEVDLEECVTSAKVLDWIIQVRGKEWPGYSEAEVVGYLVMALDDVLRVQASLCSFGRDLRMTREELVHRVQVSEIRQALRLGEYS